MNYEELAKSLREMQSVEYCVITSVEDLPAIRIVQEAADAIEDLENKLNLWRQDKISRWIPVTERLPEEEESVFVVRKFLGVKGQVPPSTYTEIAYRIGDRWVADSDEYKIARYRHTDPLYWMPLPAPPQEDA